MRSDLGKRVMILLLGGVFLALCYLSVKGPESAETGIDRSWLDNTSLYIEFGEDGTLRICGEGKISRKDFDTMVGGRLILVESIENIVVEDGITELGYNVFHDLDSLTTLRIGDGVRVVHNGAVKRCAKLRYVYVPAGLTRVGRDFLYDCPRARVVSNGPAEALPEMKNAAEKNHALCNVDSYEALLNALQLPYAVFVPEQLNWEGETLDAEGAALLEQGEVQFGPYCPLNAGTYNVRVLGSGFAGEPAVYFDAYNLGKLYEVSDAFIADDILSYVVSFDEALPLVEFRLRNNAEGDIHIRGIELYALDDALPAALEQWWD